jgi:SOS-response transcriptional repressor LexA
VTAVLPDWLTGDHVLKAQSDHAESSVLAGDTLVIRETETAEVGQLVIAEVDGLASLRRFVVGDRVTGLVVGLVRAIHVG